MQTYANENTPPGNGKASADPIPTPSSPPDFISRQVTEARYYYLTLDPSPKTPLVVVCGGCERCRPEYRIDRECFPYAGLEFVTEGRGLVSLDGHRHRLRPGTVFTYGPNTVCTIRNDAAAPLRKHFVDFTGTEALALLARTHATLGQAAHIPDLQGMEALFDLLAREGIRGGPNAPALTASLLRAILLKLAEAIPPDQAGNALALATFQRCRRIVDDHFDQLASLSDIAARAHVDVSYMCRLFRRFHNETPYRYLMRRKMNHAANLLISEGLMVKEAAHRLGISDPYHFSRAFKSVFGVSPRRFLAVQHRGRTPRRNAPT